MSTGTPVALYGAAAGVGDANDANLINKNDGAIGPVTKQNNFYQQDQDHLHEAVILSKKQQILMENKGNLVPNANTTSTTISVRTSLPHYESPRQHKSLSTEDKKKKMKPFLVYLLKLEEFNNYGRNENNIHVKNLTMKSTTMWCTNPDGGETHACNNNNKMYQGGLGVHYKTPTGGSGIHKNPAGGLGIHFQNPTGGSAVH